MNIEFDKGISKKWNENRFFRSGIKSMSLAAKAALIFGTVHFAKRGHKTAVAWCFGLGAVGIIADIVTALIFRRK